MKLKRKFLLGYDFVAYVVIVGGYELFHILKFIYIKKRSCF